MTSSTEENYLKTIFHLFESDNGNSVSTSALADASKTKAASVTDMLKRLAEKDLINYKKYQGVSLTEKGKKIALDVIRKHRLWEVFLVEKLGFSWDAIHEIAEQLEHINSVELIDKLEAFLEYPIFDPHGDPIPNAKGEMPILYSIQLSEAQHNKQLMIRKVAEDSTEFLKHLDKISIKIGTKIKIVDKSDYDDSLLIVVNDSEKLTISKAVSNNLYVTLL